MTSKIKWKKKVFFGFENIWKFSELFWIKCIFGLINLFAVDFDVLRIFFRSVGFDRSDLSEVLECDKWVFPLGNVAIALSRLSSPQNLIAKRNSFTKRCRFSRNQPEKLLYRDRIARKRHSIASASVQDFKRREKIPKQISLLW